MAKRRASIGDRPLPATSQPRATDSLLLGMERTRQEVVDLLLREIMPNRFQPRTQPNPEGLEELAESIRQHGVIEPILVRPIPLTDFEGAGRRYELVAGERRWRACMLAKQATVPAIVLADTTDDRALLELAITENLQREDLHPLDEAIALGRMQTELGYSYAQIAERLGKSKGYVQNRMRLLTLEDDLQKLVSERPDTLGHVYEIARLSDPTARTALIAAVRDDALSRAETRARVQALLNPAPAPAEPAAADAYFQKYDREERHDVARPSTPEPPAYFQKYDRDTSHKEQRHGTRHTNHTAPTPSAPPRPQTSDTSLTAQERTVLVAVTAKVDRWLADQTAITADDRAIIEPLTRRLNDMLSQIARAQHRE